MFNFISIAKEYIKKHNPNWPAISDDQYRILVVGGCGSAKPNTLLNLISHQPDNEIVYLYTKEPFEAKYQLIINKRETQN